jgi:hypothetical protein
LTTSERRNPLTLRSLIFALIASIAALAAFAAATGGSEKEYGNVSMAVTAAIAMGLGIVLVYKQRGHGIRDTATISLTVGLALWYCAEIAWAYSAAGGPESAGAAENALKQTGYAFWMAGAIPFIYYLYKTLKYFGGIVNPHVLLAVSAAAVILLSLAIPAYASDLPVAYRFFTYVLFKDTQNPEDIVYVRGDLDDVLIRTVPSFFTAVLIAMSIIILVTIWRNADTHTYWVLSTISLITYGFAEAFRSYSVFTGAGPDALGAAYPFFGASYLVMAVGMLWYIRFFERIEGVRVDAD